MEGLHRRATPRRAPLQYVQFDAFQLDERELDTSVTYRNKRGRTVTAPLVQKYAMIMVDAFSKFGWVLKTFGLSIRVSEYQY